MGRAEVGSSKHLANQMKSKGLQRLRWYCQMCEKQCRDANGFKCHVQSESHVRQMNLVGENPQKYIQGFSNDFQRDFISLLRTAHGEKAISANKFYQEYIRDKEHIHLNATRFPSLTEFVKHLGREGICVVKEGEDEKDGLMIAWRDTSAAAVKRKEEIRELELAEARSGAGEDKMLKKMAKRAQEEADEKARILEARKAATKQDSASPLAQDNNGSPVASPEDKKVEGEDTKDGKDTNDGEGAQPAPAAPAAPVKISFGMKAKVVPTTQMKKSNNVFKRAKPDKENEEKPKKRMKL